MVLYVLRASWDLYGIGYVKQLRHHANTFFLYSFVMMPPNARCCSKPKMRILHRHTVSQLNVFSSHNKFYENISYL